MCILTTMTNKAVFRAFWGTVYRTAFRWVERLSGNGSLPGTPTFFCDQKKVAKKSPAVADAVRGCARGATVERSETGERTMIAPAGQSTARAGLRSKLAALVVRRQAGPRLRGCTPLRTPIRKSEGAGAKRKQYYFSFLTPPPLPPP